MPRRSESTGSSGTKKRSTEVGQSRLFSLSSKRSTGLTSLGEMDPQIVTETIDKIVASGALISFGLTADGGALSIFVKDGAERVSLYAHHDHELEEALRELNLAYSE